MDLSFLLDQYNIRSLEDLRAALPLIMRNIVTDLAEEVKRRNLPPHAMCDLAGRPGAIDLQPLEEMRPMSGGYPS